MMAKPLQEFPGVFGGHFISVNISPRKEEGSLVFIGVASFLVFKDEEALCLSQLNSCDYKARQTHNFCGLQIELVVFAPYMLGKT